MSGGAAVGMFVGLESSAGEYLAQFIAPYRADLAIEIGTLIIVRGPDEGIVARVVDYVPRGELMSAMGEKWLNEIASQGAIDDIGQDIKRSKVSYRVRIKVLGSVRGGEFAPGLRRIPQITSKVELPSDAEFAGIMRSALAEQSSGVDIGRHALKGDVRIRFDQRELNEKRTFVFARAGYGKSNLMKLLCREWRPENGGLLVFDQDGEYAVTDRKGRPGVMDARPAVLATNQGVDPNLRNVCRTLRMDLGRLPHRLLIPLLVDPFKHEMVFFAKLMAMSPDRWPDLVELLSREGWNAGYDAVEDIVLDRRGASASQGRPVSEVDVKPILNNLVKPIRDLHERGSRLVPIVERALRDGHVVILDVSRVDAATARMTSSIIVRRIFNENRDNFIRHGGADLIRATFVLEEAHNVLQGQRDAPSAFVDLAKEGRKYGLGGIFITQQPGAIPPEIVSQGDNFFVFHLLSRVDLEALSKANAHYSADVITQVLSEPVRGKCYMWTSHQPFVVPVAVNNFEEGTRPRGSAAVQEASPLLDGMLEAMTREENDPVLKSIYAKFDAVEADDSVPAKARPTQLFKRLDPAEKKYLADRGCIQDGYNGPFAIKYVCYDRLRRREMA